MVCWSLCISLTGLQKFFRGHIIGSPILRLGELYILRNIDQHRSWTPTASNTEGLMNDGSQFLSITHQEIMLGDGLRHANHISFLESITTDKRAAHLTCNCHNRC